MILPNFGSQIEFTAFIISMHNDWVAISKSVTVIVEQLLGNILSS